MSFCFMVVLVLLVSLLLLNADLVDDVEAFIKEGDENILKLDLNSFLVELEDANPVPN